MSRRSRFNASRRRRMLGFQVAESLDQRLESRSTVTPIGAAGLAITAGAALGQAVSMHAIVGGGGR